MGPNFWLHVSYFALITLVSEGAAFGTVVLTYMLLSGRSWMVLVEQCWGR